MLYVGVASLNLLFACVPRVNKVKKLILDNMRGCTFRAVCNSIVLCAVVNQV